MSAIIEEFDELPKILKVNKPSYYEIRDSKNEISLFSGFLVEPLV